MPLAVLDCTAASMVLQDDFGGSVGIAANRLPLSTSGRMAGACVAPGP